MDSTQLQILPLSLIMVMGPQILTAIFLVTSHEPVKNSAAMLVGVVVAAMLSLVIWFGLYDVLNVKPRSGSGPSTADYVVAGLLALAGIHTFLGRKHASGPEVDERPSDGRAEARLQPRVPAHPPDADRPRRGHLHCPLASRQPRQPVHAWPLVAATTLLMALPILGYLLLGHRARDAMPGIRDWLTTNAWLVNLIVIVYFIYELLK